MCWVLRGQAHYIVVYLNNMRCRPISSLLGDQFWVIGQPCNTTSHAHMGMHKAIMRRSALSSPSSPYRRTNQVSKQNHMFSTNTSFLIRLVNRNGCAMVGASACHAT